MSHIQMSSMISPVTPKSEQTSRPKSEVENSKETEFGDVFEHELNNSTEHELNEDSADGNGAVGTEKTSNEDSAEIVADVEVQVSPAASVGPNAKITGSPDGEAFDLAIPVPKSDGPKTPAETQHIASQAVPEPDVVPSIPQMSQTVSQDGADEARNSPALKPSAPEPLRAALSSELPKESTLSSQSPGNPNDVSKQTVDRKPSVAEIALVSRMPQQPPPAAVPTQSLTPQANSSALTEAEVSIPTENNIKPNEPLDQAIRKPQGPPAEFTPAKPHAVASPTTPPTVAAQEMTQAGLQAELESGQTNLRNTVEFVHSPQETQVGTERSGSSFGAAPSGRMDMARSVSQQLSAAVAVSQDGLIEVALQPEGVGTSENLNSDPGRRRRRDFGSGRAA